MEGYADYVIGLMDELEQDPVFVKMIAGTQLSPDWEEDLPEDLFLDDDPDLYSEEDLEESFQEYAARLLAEL